MFNGFYEALLVLAGYLLINLVFGNILEPRIMGRGLGLSTLVVFLSLIFWGWLLGPVGMLLSVPLTIIVKIALEQTAGGQSIAVLLSDLTRVTASAEAVRVTELSGLHPRWLWRHQTACGCFP